MRTNAVTGTLLIMFAAASLYQASAQPVTLTGTSYTNTFDTLEADAGLPPEWTTYTGASATLAGTIATWGAVNYTAASNSWRTTSGRFANQASTFSYLGGTNFIGSETNAIQQSEPNRCMAVRQVTATDSGVAFVLKIAETSNRKNFQMFVNFLNLDPTSTRTTTWTVDYGIGGPPFVPVATWTNVAGTFRTFPTNITFPNGTIDNIAGPVWVRVVVLTPTTGSGNRETFGMDNFGLTWEPGVACTPVSITGHPQPVSGYVNGTASFTCGAVGTAPRYYQWLKNGSVTLVDDGHFSGTTGPTLSIINLTTGDAGLYSCVVSNVCDTTLNSQTSTAASLSVSTPSTVSIGYLRTLVDPTTFAPTNMNLLYTTTGLITTYTNVTSGNTASYYIQDGTGGINLFCTFGSAFRPAIGDVVTAVGFLSSFGGSLELAVDLSKSAQSVTVLSNNIAAYPAAKLISWDGLNQFGTNASLNYNLVGSVVVLTNAYFGTNAGFVTSTTNANLFVTNSSGQPARVFLYSQQDNDLTNRTIPAFAPVIRGILISATGNQYEVAPTAWSEVVTTVPTVTLDTPANGASFTAPANLSLSATVTDNGYAISAVNFYNGATLLASDTAAPYTYAWNSVGAGSYNLSAEAVYPLFGTNLSAFSAANSVAVTGSVAPVSTMSIGPGTGNTLNIAYTGGTASQFVLRGTNVVSAPIDTWPIILTTNGTTPGAFNIPIGSGQMYYRIQSQ